MDDRPFVTVEDYEPVARERLPRDVYDYYAGGAGDEWTLAENRRAFERWVIRPRLLTGSYPPDPSIELLGSVIDFPVLIAPWAYQRLAHPDGEVATARAAARAGTIMVVSSTAQAYLEDVAAGSDAPKWWQLYIFTDREVTADMLKRVHASGFTAICFTVDLPVVGLRHRDTRNAFEMQVGLPQDDLVFEPNITWDDIGWIREQAPLPLLLKGIMTAEDATLAIEADVDGIVVSNHGARQLDAVAAPLTVLPEIVDAVQGRVPVLVDGGFRRGTDVFTALALGASAVLVGRPTVWGLAAAGEDGVVDVLRILREELENVMTLAGTRTVGDITSAFLAPA
ncbi:MAG: alpha-hydroxy-acid oxidizing protein [Actinobacteria bacterium]|nr:alpha-hydroxy-acid oxidizing protein [Actinomycetota bacterium]